MSKKSNWMRGFVITPPLEQIEIAQKTAWCEMSRQRKQSRKPINKVVVK